MTTPEEIWQTALRKIQLGVTRLVFETWVQNVVALDLDAASGEMTLGVATRYNRDWLEFRLQSVVNQALSAAAGRPVQAVFVVLNPPATAMDNLPPTRETYNAAEAVARQVLPAEMADEALTTLNWQADALAKLSPGVRASLQSYLADPVAQLREGVWLFLYGTTGTGKTHIAAGVARRAMEAGWRVAFINPKKDFLDRLRATIDASRRKDFGETERSILAEFEQVDLLVLDDLGLSDCNAYGDQHLSALIKARRAAKHPVLVTTNHSPDELFSAGLGEAALDRLTCGKVFRLSGESWRGRRRRPTSVVALPAANAGL